MTLQQTMVAAIVAGGGAIVQPAPSTNYVALDFKGLRYWVGRLGALRQGPTLRRARRHYGRVSVLDCGDGGVIRGAEGGWDVDPYSGW